MRKVIIESENGIHARPASEIVNYAQSYDGEIYFIKDDNRYNAKSIMNIMGMGLQKGDAITIEVTGKDSTEIEENLVNIINAIKE